MTDEDIAAIETRATNSDCEHKQDICSLISELRRVRRGPAQRDPLIEKVRQAWGVLSERDFGVDVDDSGELTRVGIEALFDLLPNYSDELGLSAIPEYAALSAEDRRDVQNLGLHQWLVDMLRTLEPTS